MFIQTIKCALSTLCFQNDVLVYVIIARGAAAQGAGTALTAQVRGWGATSKE